MDNARFQAERHLDEMRARRHADPGAPETVRVRMSVDLTGEFGDELGLVAESRGMTREALVREGLGYVFQALQARRGAPFVGRP